MVYGLLAAFLNDAREKISSLDLAAGVRDEISRFVDDARNGRIGVPELLEHANEIFGVYEEFRGLYGDKKATEFFGKTPREMEDLYREIFS